MPELNDQKTLSDKLSKLQKKLESLSAEMKIIEEPKPDIKLGEISKKLSQCGTFTACGAVNIKGVKEMMDAEERRQREEIMNQRDEALMLEDLSKALDRIKKNENKLPMKLRNGWFERGR